jgi:hypothetical protein
MLTAPISPRAITPAASWPVSANLSLPTNARPVSHASVILPRISKMGSSPGKCVSRGPLLLPANFVLSDQASDSRMLCGHDLRDSDLADPIATNAMSSGNERRSSSSVIPPDGQVDVWPLLIKCSMHRVGKAYRTGQA